MQQSILALGALMIITMLSVQQQRSSFMVLEGMFLRELENAAADYAKKRTEEILDSVSFDESRVSSSELDTDVATLTAAAGFGPDVNEDDVASYDDLDDYHTYQETVTHVLSADTFRFNVSYDVRYVNPDNPSSTALTPTLAKEFSILVLSTDSIGTQAAQYRMSKTVVVSDLL